MKGAAAAVHEKQTVSVGKDFTVEFVSASHKRGGKESLGMWSFVITKGGRRLEVELRSSELTGWQAEIVAHGSLLVFQHVGYTEFNVTLVPGLATKALTEDEAADLIAKTAHDLGLPSASSSYNENEGILYYTARREDRLLWKGYCGLFTRRVWFAPK